MSRRAVVLVCVGGLLCVLACTVEFGGAPTLSDVSDAARRNFGLDTVLSSPANSELRQPQRETRRRVPSRARRSSGTLRIHVVHRESRKPVEGASVWFLEKEPAGIPASRWERASLFSSLSRTVELFERLGSRRRTDREGRVEIPLTSWGARCMVRKGSLFGVLARPSVSAGETCVIELETDVALDVRVVDRWKRPVGGVGVHLLRSSAASGRAGTEQAYPFPYGRSSTPDGVVTLRHLQRSQRRWPRGTDGRRYTRIHLEVLGDWGAGVRIDLDRARGAPIDVVVPPAGDVIVAVRGADGCRVGDGHLVELAVVRSAEQVGPPVARCHVLMHRVEGAVAAFPHVATGQRLRATLRHGGRIFSREFDGPMRDGETVNVTLRASLREVVLSGRALDENGRALRNCRLAASVHDRLELRTFRARCVTDHTGRFRAALPSGAAELELGAIAFECSSGRCHRIARGPCLGVVQPGERPIGDVVLRAAPHLVRGRVVDSEGRPVPRARCVVERRSMDGAWRELNRVDTESDGSFDSYGVSAGRAVRLQVLARGYRRSVPVAFSPGDRNVNVELLQARDRDRRIRESVREVLNGRGR